MADDQHYGFELLKAGSASLGLTLTRRQLRQFADYQALLLDWNQRFNLTTITAPGAIQSRHFVDSLSALPLLPGRAATLIDVGSGPGFPGLPLAIVRPDLSVTLVEATGKKCRFLEAVVEQLRLPDVAVVHARAELQA